MRNWLIKIATSILLCLSLALSSIGFLSMSAFAGTPDNGLPTAPAAVKVNAFTIIDADATTVEPLSDPYTCSIGDIITLDVIFSPENAEAKYKKVVWESNNPDAIGIEAIEGSDTQAKITAKKLGRYEITAIVKNNEAYKEKWITKSLTINVNQPPVKSITLGKSTLEMTKSTQEKLTATVSPASADQTVTWTSSDTNVAAVNEEGLVVASETNTGIATITATAGDKTATCTVYVDVVVIENTKAPKKANNTTNCSSFQKGVFTVTFDNKGGLCSNFQNDFGWYFYANNATTTVTSTDKQNITITKCKFYTNDGSAEVTESPFTVYSWDCDTFTGSSGTGTYLGKWGVTKIEVYFTRNA